MNTVLNPLTKRQINVGSTVYWKLVNKGLIEDVTGQVQQPQVRQPPVRQPPVKQPSISKAYNNLRPPQVQQYGGQPQYGNTFQQMQVQQPQKIKKTPQQKINNIINESVRTYSNVMNSVDPQDFNDDNEFQQYIAEQLKAHLKQSGNKHLNKYL